MASSAARSKTRPLHHGANTPRVGDVREWVGIEDDEVGRLSRGDPQDKGLRRKC